MQCSDWLAGHDAAPIPRVEYGEWRQNQKKKQYGFRMERCGFPRTFRGADTKKERMDAEQAGKEGSTLWVDIRPEKAAGAEWVFWTRCSPGHLSPRRKF